MVTFSGVEPGEPESATGPEAVTRPEPAGEVPGEPLAEPTAEPPDPSSATTSVELTVLLVAQARRRRHQLRALEADTGISKTTWSAWGRGQRAVGRERLLDVARRYDPQRVDAWLAAWDRLADGDQVRDLRGEPAAVAEVVRGESHPVPAAARASAAARPPRARRWRLRGPAVVGLCGALVGATALGVWVGAARSASRAPAPLEQAATTVTSAEPLAPAPTSGPGRSGDQAQKRAPVGSALQVEAGPIDQASGGPGVVGAGDVGPGAAGPGAAGSGQGGSGRVGSGRVGSGQGGSGQIGSGQGGSGQIGSGRVGPGEVGPGAGAEAATGPTAPVEVATLRGAAPRAGSSSARSAAGTTGSRDGDAEPVRVVFPAPGTQVEGCLIVTGTGRTEAGRILVVTVRDWTSPAALFRITPVTTWTDDGKGRWRVQQPLAKSSPAGYELLVVTVDARISRVERDLSMSAGPGWTAPYLPAGARVVAAQRVYGGPGERCPAG